MPLKNHLLSCSWDTLCQHLLLRLHFLFSSWWASGYRLRNYHFSPDDPRLMWYPLIIDDLVSVFFCLRDPLQREFENKLSFYCHVPSANTIFMYYVGYWDFYTWIDIIIFLTIVVLKYPINVIAKYQFSIIVGSSAWVRLGLRNAEKFVYTYDILFSYVKYCITYRIRKLQWTRGKQWQCWGTLLHLS